MNFKTLAVAGILSVTAILGVAQSSDARTVRSGDAWGYQGVTTVDNGWGATDYITVPFTSGTGLVSVNCATGDYTWNGIIGQPEALRIVRAWCRY